MNHKDVRHISYLNEVGVLPHRWTTCEQRYRGKHCGHVWNDTANFCFQTSAWLEARFTTILLKKVHRQSDPKWIELLERIKRGKITKPDTIYLKGLMRPLPRPVSAEEVKPLKLYTHRAQVNLENQIEYDKIDKPEFYYRAEDTGETYKRDKLKRTLSHLELANERKFCLYSQFFFTWRLAMILISVS